MRCFADQSIGFDIFCNMGVNACRATDVASSGAKFDGSSTRWYIGCSEQYARDTGCVCSFNHCFAVGVELRMQQVCSNIDHGKAASFACNIGTGLPMRCP